MPLTAEPKSRAPVVREVPAVRRAVAVLFHLGRSQQAATLSQIARELGIVPSSCLHILRELTVSGLVVADGAAKTYALGPAVLSLAKYYQSSNRFVDLVRPHLLTLARRFEVDASAHEVDAMGHVSIVATADPDRDVQVRLPLGRRFPLLSGASGRLIAAFNGLAPAQLEQEFARVRWQNPPTLARWRREVQAARTSGIGVDEGCYRRGLTAIAAPVQVQPGPVTRIIGALCITGQLTPASRRQLTEALQGAAAAVAAELERQAGVA